MVTQIDQKGLVDVAPLGLDANKERMEEMHASLKNMEVPAMLKNVQVRAVWRVDVKVVV